MRLYAPPTPVEVASEAVRDLLALRGMRVAAICLEHGVSELWSADRD
ncbi:MAG: hypothetical protein WCG47_25015 [Dermatophilaceae bacterium]